MWMTVKPTWLQGLMEETFFANCVAHENRRKNEKNIFCLQCCLSFCPHCLPSHLSHPLLQVRRYVYHDVVRLADLDQLIDCSYIQPYTINGAKVMFLNARPQTRLYKVAASICFTCDRILQPPFNFCSLSCKVNHHRAHLSTILFGFSQSDFTFPDLRMDGTHEVEDDRQMTPNSIMEERVLHFEHGSSYSNQVVSMGHNSSGQVKESVQRNKNEGFLPPMAAVLSVGNRRKGAPHRSPLA